MLADLDNLLGKRILELQTSLALLSQPISPPQAESEDHYGRIPFQHPDLRNLSELTSEAKKRTLDIKRIGEVAANFGLLGVLRWKPKNVQSSFCSIRGIIRIYKKLTCTAHRLTISKAQAQTMSLLKHFTHLSGPCR